MENKDLPIQMQILNSMQGKWECLIHLIYIKEIKLEHCWKNILPEHADMQRRSLGSFVIWLQSLLMQNEDSHDTPPSNPNHGYPLQGPVGVASSNHLHWLKCKAKAPSPWLPSPQYEKQR